jgi:hypothetical protein
MWACRGPAEGVVKKKNLLEFLKREMVPKGRQPERPDLSGFQIGPMNPFRIRMWYH